ncbi:MAG: low molecular weight phosphatase family protein [Rhizobiaceae bacterium]|nr:low molecular weight phosphatase family protein [Rhizobiaceae bacterium]
MNSVRSPVAEALARKMLPANTFIASAGVRAGDPDPFVEAILAEEGLGLGDRTPRTLDDLEDDYFDLIITLAPEAHHAALELTRSMAIDVEYWPTLDPTVTTGSRDQILNSYRDMRERLKARIQSRFAPDSTK